MPQPPTISDLRRQCQANEHWLKARGFKPHTLPGTYRWFPPDRPWVTNYVEVVLTGIGMRQGVYLGSVLGDKPFILIEEGTPMICRIAMLMEAIT